MPRRLIVCADGTWSSAEQDSPTNVVKIARAILPEAPDGTPQIVSYDPGVGTDNLLDKITGGAFGVGLSRNVMDAYRALVHNYAEGDEVYFFGFSRGAYTVRSAAGFIRKCGLLRKRHAGKLREAYDIYRKKDRDPDTREAESFANEYSHEPFRIKFIGVWDTVGSLGIPLDPLRFLARGRYDFHDTRLSRSVDYAYHAVAIDERRGPFKPTLWEQSPEADSVGQVMEQCWFSGFHMDVGGGNATAELSDLAMLWLVEKARDTGLVFDEMALLDLEPDGRGRLHNSMSLLYFPMPRFVRPIGVGVRANELVHGAALERLANDPEYNPPNLAEYVARPGPS